MNVIVANKYKDMLMTLDIDVIKSIEGVYDAEEISDMFENFFFQFMILDITAINNYQDINNLQKLSIGLDMNKIILVLDDSKESASPDYLSKLISLGIYNFTRNKEGIKYLMANPNSYRDVADLHQLNSNTGPAEEIPIKKEKHKKEHKKENQETEDIKIPKLIVEEEPVEEEIETLNIEEDLPKVEEAEGKLPNIEQTEQFESFSSDKEEEPEDEIIESTDIEESSKPFFNSMNEESSFDVDSNSLMENDITGNKIIGVKNITDHAGATSFIYMIKEQLKNEINVVGIEVDKVDFTFFKDPKLITSSKTGLATEILKQKDADVVLVDLNEFENLDICTDILYLIEPSTIRLNKLMLKSKDIFKKLQGKKIILNKSLLTDKDVDEFEYEAKTKIFYNLPPINDRELPNKNLEELLNKLGINKNVN